MAENAIRPLEQAFDEVGKRRLKMSLVPDLGPHHAA